MYDIDTPDGLAAAAEWLTGHISMIKDGGVWVIPRSITIVIIYHSTKQYSMVGPGDSSTRKVFKAIGWSEK